MQCEVKIGGKEPVEDENMVLIKKKETGKISNQKSFTKHPKIYLKVKAIRTNRFG